MQEMRRTASRCACLLALVAVVAGCLPATALALTEQKITFISTPPNPAYTQLQYPHHAGSRASAGPKRMEALEFVSKNQGLEKADCETTV